MNSLTRTLLIALSVVAVAAVPAALGQAVSAAVAQEEAKARLAFDVAKRFFRNENYASAIERLEAFSLQYPDSLLKPEAVLMENQARFQLGQFEGMVTELQEGLLAVMEKHGFETIEDMRGHAIPALTTHHHLVELQQEARARKEEKKRFRDKEWGDKDIKDAAANLVSD